MPRQDGLPLNTSAFTGRVDRRSNPCFSLERADGSLTRIRRTEYAQTRENRVGRGSHRSDRRRLFTNGQVPSSALESPRTPIAMATKWQRGYAQSWNGSQHRGCCPHRAVWRQFARAKLGRPIVMTLAFLILEVHSRCLSPATGNVFLRYPLELNGGGVFIAPTCSAVRGLWDSKRSARKGIAVPASEPMQWPPAHAGERLDSPPPTRGQSPGRHPHGVVA